MRCIRYQGRVSDSNQFFLLLSRDLRKSFSYIDIDLGTDTEFRKVNPRLDGETGTCNYPAHIMRLQIVHVGTRPMDVGADAMTGSMEKESAKTLRVDVASYDIVHLIPGDVAPLRYGLDDELGTRFARIPHNTEDILHSVGNGST